MQSYPYTERQSDNKLLVEILGSLLKIEGLLQKQVDKAESAKRASEPSLGLEGIPLFSSTKKSSAKKKKTTKKKK